MMAFGKRLALVGAALAIAWSGAAAADDFDIGKASDSALRSKIEYCKMCHGENGQGFRGFVPIPRLAGQQAEYIENQLQSAVAGRRRSKLMSDILRSIAPSMRRPLAVHFSQMVARPLGGAPRDLVGTGRKIFEEGIPEANVPACMACHGKAAQGHNQVPRLAGQLDDYIISKLSNWSNERVQAAPGGDPARIMAVVARNLTRSQMSAVAAYLSNLP
jgi:cytochrome c553